MTMRNAASFDTEVVRDLAEMANGINPLANTIEVCQLTPGDAVDLKPPIEPAEIDWEAARDRFDAQSATERDGDLDQYFERASPGETDTKNPPDVCQAISHAVAGLATTLASSVDPLGSTLEVPPAFIAQIQASLDKEAIARGQVIFQSMMQLSTKLTTFIQNFTRVRARFSGQVQELAQALMISVTEQDLLNISGAIQKINQAIHAYTLGEKLKKHITHRAVLSKLKVTQIALNEDPDFTVLPTLWTEIIEEFSVIEGKFPKHTEAGMAQVIPESRPAIALNRRVKPEELFGAESLALAFQTLKEQLAFAKSNFALPTTL